MRTQGGRADRLSTGGSSAPLGMSALELQVTETVMRFYARRVRNGTLNIERSSIA